MEDKVARMKAWIEDQAKHEDIPSWAEGYRMCLPAFAGNKPALDIEQLIIDTKNAILLVAAGNPRETSPLCFKLIAMQRVVQKWRDIQ